MTGGARELPGNAVAAVRSVAAVALLMLAACTPENRPSADSTADTRQPPPADQTADQATGAGGEQDGEHPSILRPEVATVVTPEQIAPETITLPFGFNTGTIDDSAKAAIDTLLAGRAVTAGGAITIRGHSDSRGYDEDNRRVSLRRAEAVRDYLIEKGIAPARITTIGLGETRPIAPNANLDGSDDPQGRERNRRVEIEVAGSEQASPAPAAGTTQE